MSLSIKKAVKEQSKLRLALAGPAGAGKTWTGLGFATVLAEGGKIVVIDTEHGRSKKYADVFDFDIIELDTFSPKMYMEALALAYKEGAAVVLIDSLSHAWNGEDGILEQVGRNFNNWKEATPLQNRLMNTIQRSPFHVIATMRSKSEYVVEMVNGKATPKKVGTAVIQRDGVDFEFDVFGMLDREHNLLIEKSVCRKVPVGKSYNEPDSEIATTLLHWLKDGKVVTSAPEALPTDNTTPQATPSAEDEIFNAALAQQAPQRPTRPAPVTSEAMATDRQISSTRKLCAALGRPEPEMSTYTFAAARELLTSLSQAYSEARQAS
jgi:hypothetical protein